MKKKYTLSHIIEQKHQGRKNGFLEAMGVVYSFDENNTELHNLLREIYEYLVSMPMPPTGDDNEQE